jgi:Skp family chaperone for outer membrane proteins
MKFSFKVISIFFLLFGFSSANESIKFVDINYIVNNSISGKKLNQIIENKNKKIISELNDLGKKLNYLLVSATILIIAAIYLLIKF